MMYLLPHVTTNRLYFIINLVNVKEGRFRGGILTNVGHEPRHACSGIGNGVWVLSFSMKFIEKAVKMMGKKMTKVTVFISLLLPDHPNRYFDS
jgi:hypothetical protein